MKPVRNNDMDRQTDALRLIYRLPGCCCLIYLRVTDTIKMRLKVV